MTPEDRAYADGFEAGRKMSAALKMCRESYRLGFIAGVSEP